MLSYRRTHMLNTGFLTRSNHAFEIAAFDSIRDGNQTDVADAIKLIDTRSKGEIFTDIPSILAIDSIGATFLSHALYHSQEQIANDLIDYYLVDKKDTRCLWVTDKHLRTPLWMAISHGYDKIVEKLLAHADQELIATHTDIPDNANCFALETSDKFTILQTAVMLKRENILQQLLKKMSTLENAVELINVVDVNGDALLHHACDTNNVKMVTLLLQHMCYVNNLNNSKQTVLHVACKNANAPLVELLLQHGADLYRKDVNDMRPFDHVPEEKRQTFYEVLAHAGMLIGKNLKKAAYKSAVPLDHSAPFLAVGTLFAPDKAPAAAITSKKDAHSYLHTTKNPHEQAAILANTRLSIEKQKNPDTQRELLDFYLPLVAVHKNLQTLITEKFNLDSKFLNAVPVKLQLGNMPVVNVTTNDKDEQVIEFLDALKPIPFYLAKVVESLQSADENSNDSDEELEQVNIYGQKSDDKITLLNTLNDNRDDILQLVQLLKILHDELTIYSKKLTAKANVIEALPALGFLASSGLLTYFAIQLHHYDDALDTVDGPHNVALFCVFLLLVLLAALALIGLAMIIWSQIFADRLYSQTQDTYSVSRLAKEHTEHLTAVMELTEKFVDEFHKNHPGENLDATLSDLFINLRDSQTTIMDLNNNLKELEKLLREIMAEKINIQRTPTHSLRLFSPRNLDIFKTKEEDEQTWLLEKRDLFELV